MQHHVRHQFAVLAHLDLWPNHAVRPDAAGLRNPGARIDDGSGVNQELRVASSELRVMRTEDAMNIDVDA